MGLGAVLLLYSLVQLTLYAAPSKTKGSGDSTCSSCSLVPSTKVESVVNFESMRIYIVVVRYYGKLVCPIKSHFYAVSNGVFFISAND